MAPNLAPSQHDLIHDMILDQKLTTREMADAATRATSTAPPEVYCPAPGGVIYLLGSIAYNIMKEFYQVDMTMRIPPSRDIYDCSLLINMQ